jgi:hypothetical protein
VIDLQDSNALYRKGNNYVQFQGLYIYERMPVEKSGGWPFDDISMTMAFTTTPWSLPRIRHWRFIRRCH